MLVTYVGWTIAAGRFAASNNTNHAAGQTVLAMIFLYYAMYDLAWCGLLVGYVAEILPYNIRAKGLTVMFFSVDLSRESSMPFYFPTLGLRRRPSSRVKVFRC